MASIRKAGPWNPQKATAYVGKGVLRNGDTLSPIKGSITPVPNGHLIKKDGTSLKKGGKMGRSEMQFGLNKKQKASKEVNPAGFRKAALKRESELVEKRSGEMAPKLKSKKK